jgi:hypothetical protein
MGMMLGIALPLYAVWTYFETHTDYTINPLHLDSQSAGGGREAGESGQMQCADSIIQSGHYSPVIRVDGDGWLVLTDSEGRKLGFENGQYFDDIPIAIEMLGESNALAVESWSAAVGVSLRCQTPLKLLSQTPAICSCEVVTALLP